MGSSVGDNKKPSEIVEIVRSWMPRQPEIAKMSRDFWMPDASCRVCYECDSPFTIFNRKHHCRLCGRVFCARCTTTADEPKTGGSREDGDNRIKVCNFCLKQWKQESTVGNGMIIPSPGLSLSPSSSSLISNQSSCCTFNSSSTGSAGYSQGPFHHVSCADGRIPSQFVDFVQMDSRLENKDQMSKLDDLDSADAFGEQFGSRIRSDYDDGDYPICGSHSGAAPIDPFNMGYDTVDYNQVDHMDVPYEVHPKDEIQHPICDSIATPENCEKQGSDVTTGYEKEADLQQNYHVQRELPPLDDLDHEDGEVIEYEENGLIWLPPEPEDEEDDREGLAFDDDEAVEDAKGEWGYMRTSSFVDREYRNRDKSNEEHRKAMKRVVDGHFRALITQLLQAENLPATEHESWLDIITALSWEAANLVKPDTSIGGGMDPGGYVKVKCIACGHRNESMVIRGVVCKKNVAHRRMGSKIDKARLLLLGGALEYQRVANHLSSFDTLLQQEMDHLKMAVAKIDVHHPNVLLVEKSVSRYAQEYLLAKNISLVLNTKRPLLERIARCTGAQIVPSIDNLSSPKLGYCDSFHVEKFLEDHGTAGQGGKKLTKTLMFFEGCPRPLGCTILLKGAGGDELKKVKHIVHYGVFAAYHLALETSFLADEGASLPELPLKRPIKVALRDKPSSANVSISVIPGYIAPSSEKHPEQKQPEAEPFCFSASIAQTPNAEAASRNVSVTKSNANFAADPDPKENGNNDLDSGISLDLEVSGRSFSFPPGEAHTMLSNLDSSEMVHSHKNNSDHHGESGIPKEEFPPSPSDNQSILVSLSTRCPLKGSICERSHLFRIKYYGNFDKPLGRFLQDNLFNQSYRCNTCEMPSEAHVHCYTHRQGSLTISLKKFQEFLLPGEREGKIWMWHRCLRCPRTNGFPPATKRVMMSNAAWGLSFGKFLELSFSNHAAASRVASCGHSLHRDCLRFYGSGRMVACFRYAPIVVHSVYLPPPKLEFNCYTQEWLLKEFDEVHSSADLLFDEVFKVIHQILRKTHNDNGVKETELDQLIAELEARLQIEKKEFEESLLCMLKEAGKSGHAEIDVLEINKLKRQLAFHAYVWDQRLIHQCSSITSNPKEKQTEMDAPYRSARGFSSWDSSFLKTNSNLVLGAVENCWVDSSKDFSDGADINQNLTIKQDLEPYASGMDSRKLPEIMKSGNTVRRARSEGQFHVMETVSDSLPTAWENSHLYSELPSEDVENPSYWSRIPFSVLYRSFCKISATSATNLVKISNYIPVYISSFKELVNLGGARLLLPMALNDPIVPIYDDEPTSIICYALVSPDYQKLMSDDPEKLKNSLEFSTSFSILDSVNLFSLHSFDESSLESSRTFGSADESRTFSGLDSLQFPDMLHSRLSFVDEGPPGKVKYSVTCYFAKQFEALRRACGASELDFIRSLSRCKKWGAQGGKSNVFFAKTLDDRFIIKQVTKTELESFIKFASSYFTYLTESVDSGCPTCLAKILGIYQVTSKHLKGGKEARMDVLVMENLLYMRNITRLYDLKGSCRSRYNPDSSGSNKVLLDQNLIEAMPTSPIFLGTKAKRLLERAIWNDTSFLASIDVMDYSLLVGVDEEKHELVVGIIDFMRQYTWDKHLENWVKASGILGGPKNVSPTVISPKQYKKRFRKAMAAYFLMVPDQWPPSSMIHSNEEQVQDKISCQ